MGAPTTRFEMDEWIARVGDSLPEGEVRDLWLKGPEYDPGTETPLRAEMEARLRVLSTILAAIQRGVDLP